MLRNKITRANLDKFLANHKTDKKILDLGSGGSDYNKYFPNRLMVDINPDRKPNVVADAHNLPFSDGEFDFVLCTEMLEHVKDPKQVISEINRVMKSGGKLVLTTRFVYPIHDAPHDYWRFTKYGLKLLFENWENVEITPETKTFSAIGALLQRIAFQTKLHLNIFIKFFLFVKARIFDKLNFLIKEEYGDIKKSQKEDHIMTTGYYVVAFKK